MKPQKSITIIIHTSLLVMLSIFSRIGTRGCLFKTASISPKKISPAILTPPVTSMQSRGMANHRHKKMIKMAKGYRGRANRCYTVAKQRVEKALQYAYRDRRTKKRNYRTLWIQKINAAARIYGYTYAGLICHLSRSNIHLNRKMLAELAMNEPLSFKSLVEVARVKGGPSPFRKPKVRVVEKTEEQIEEEMFM